MYVCVHKRPIPVSERSKVRVCGRALAGIAGSNPARDTNVLFLVSVVCCQLEISATGRSLVQRSPTDCRVRLCLIYKPEEQGGPGPRWAVVTEREKICISDKGTFFRTTN